MAASVARAFLFSIAALAILVLHASGRAQAQSLPTARVIVAGEGSEAVAPDYAHVTGGVITRGKTVKEANEANAKTMTAVTAALLDSGIPQKDIQTVQFSVQPVYVSQGANTEQRLAGFSVSNQIRVTTRQLAKVGEILRIGGDQDVRARLAVVRGGRDAAPRQAGAKPPRLGDRGGDADSNGTPHRHSISPAKH